MQTYQYGLYTAIRIYIISLIFFCKGDSKKAISLLFVGAIPFFLSAIFADEFLNLWDERFHALVAKNMMDHPLMPTLYDTPLLDLGYEKWTQASVWLHKQPLFLWQIMLSLKTFGVSVYAVRVPSAIMAIGLVIVGVRIAKILFNERVAYITKNIYLMDNQVICNIVPIVLERY